MRKLPHSQTGLKQKPNGRLADTVGANARDLFCLYGDYHRALLPHCLAYPLGAVETACGESESAAPGHHRSVQPTPWASFSFDPIEAVSAAWLLPVMALFMPIHVGTALALLMIMTINAVFNHAGWEVYPDKWIKGWWGRHIITASHHNLHHTKFKGNYGLYFRFWDKVCGTDKGLV